jgi:hypothetical protein
MSRKQRAEKQRKLQNKPNRSSLMEIDRPESTTWMSFAFIPGFSQGDPRSRIFRSPDGSPGIYIITLILCVPGRESFQESIDFQNLANSGDSLLQIGRIEFDTDIKSGDVNAQATFKSNLSGALSTIQIRVQAQNFVSAKSFAYDLIAPCLSGWSYKYDVALDVKGYEVFEEATGSKWYSLGVLGQAKDFAETENDEFVFGEEFRSIFAIYREAINSTNLFYKVLSFYKVTEGVSALINERKKQTLAKGEAWTNSSKRIPSSLEDISVDDWHKHLFTSFLGKKFTVVLDHYRGLIRNAVAHLDPAMHILDADKAADMGTCEDATPILKYIARQMLDDELRERRIASQA